MTDTICQPAPAPSLPSDPPAYAVAAFYHFGALPHYRSIQTPLHETCARLGVRGIALLAEEGVNGTMAGSRAAMEEVLETLCRLTGFNRIDHKWSTAREMPFLRLKVRLKKEIVTLGVEGVDPNRRVGTYVAPEDWNALISDPDVVVLDTRNHEEVRIGTFAGAIDPLTRSFSEFPDYVKTHLDPSKHKKIAMFCTGGIRCEKASSYLLEEGFAEVFHLKGGILNYLEKVPEDESLWQGSCFVFDRRIALGHGLVEAADLVLCGGCRTPLTAEEQNAPDFEEGVCCPHCAPLMTPERKSSARERHRQVKLAAQRGDNHLGPWTNSFSPAAEGADQAGGE
jgi:UPF0176 protein